VGKKITLKTNNIFSFQILPNFKTMLLDCFPRPNKTEILTETSNLTSCFYLVKNSTVSGIVDSCRKLVNRNNSNYGKLKLLVS